MGPGRLAAAWHALGEKAVVGLLASNRGRLSQEVAAKRLEEHGPNELEQAPPVRPLVLLLAQFKSLIVWLLVCAAIVSGLMNEWPDCIAILSIVVLNGLICFESGGVRVLLDCGLCLGGTALVDDACGFVPFEVQ